MWRYKLSVVRGCSQSHARTPIIPVVTPSSKIARYSATAKIPTFISQLFNIQKQKQPLQ